MRRRLFGIDVEEASFARRGFPAGGAAKQRRLEAVGATFIRGYMAALDQDEPARLDTALAGFDIEARGFAYEGAAMALALLDQVLPWQRTRLAAFMHGAAHDHIYMAHVGAGWAMARLRGRLGRYFHQLDPLLRWLAVDGYGFHEGYFHWQRSVVAMKQPRHLRGYAPKAFDQGLGRSLWFVYGADVERVARAIAAFLPARRADLWSGVGLAAAYAGGVDAKELTALATASGVHHADMAQGAAFAAEARERARNPAAHTSMACRILCSMTASEAARVTHVARHGLAANGDGAVYERWRQQIRNLLQKGHSDFVE